MTLLTGILSVCLALALYSLPNHALFPIIVTFYALAILSCIMSAFLSILLRDPAGPYEEIPEKHWSDNM